MLYIISLFLTILFCIISAVTYINHVDDNYCYANDKCPYILLGTKTAYEFVHGESNTSFKINECEPVQFWSLNRHGTRFPKEAEISDMRNLIDVKMQIVNNYKNVDLNSVPSGLCEQDLHLFKRWTWNNTITEKLASDLTFQGKLDMEQLAQRYKSRFPGLLDIPYSKDDFIFRFTRTERTNSSFRAFAKGLFGEESNCVKGTSVENDTLLELYRICKTWQEKVKKNPATKLEYHKFVLLPKYVEMIGEVSERLGFDTLLPNSLIETMFNMCRFEQSWFVHDKSTWCAAFTKNNLEILEYAQDLAYYFKTGFGMELNSKMGCMLLKNMLEGFQTIVSGATAKPKAILYFSHSATLQLLLSTMKLYEDIIPLRANNMDEQYDRLWRTSLLSPFAANLDAVLYRCKNDEYNVKFFLNEIPIKMPGCLDGICSWKTIQELFWSTGENCNLDFCNNNKNIFSYLF